MAREVRSSEVKDGRSILVKEEEESPLTEDIVRQLRVLRELSEAPGPESPSLGAPGLGAPGLGACPLCEAPMRLHLLPLHHGVPHHFPCLLHYCRNYTSEEDRHQHRLSYHRPALPCPALENLREGSKDKWLHPWARLLMDGPTNSPPPPCPPPGTQAPWAPFPAPKVPTTFTFSKT